MTLFLIAFIAGVLTVLAPCVLPLLPIIVGGTVSGGANKSRAFVVAFALGASVIAFTLLLKFSTAFINIPQSTWEWISGGILIIFGVVTLFPQIWDSLGFVAKFSGESNKVMSAGFMKQSFWGDVLVGAALGPVFSTCSPTYFVILATVLPASFGVGLADLLSYTAGLVLMLLIIGLVGQRVVDKLGIAADPRGWFKRIIGALFIVVGILVATGGVFALESWLIGNVYDITQVEQSLLKANQSAPTLTPSGTSTEAVDEATSSQATASSTPLTVGQKSLVQAAIAKKAMLFPKAPELTGIDGYINTPSNSGGQAGPITIGQFKGKKVVLIDIWTYSCINCQRTLPYVKSWYDKYSDKGLEIISVHTPEFAFEHLLANVQSAVTQEGIKYPVVLDNEYGTWNAFGNQYWPRKYLIDIDGFIVYDHAGEGSYDETEAAIQKALKERDDRLNIAAPMPVVGTTPADVVTMDPGKVGSPETYFGSARNQYLGNGTQGATGIQTLSLPATSDLNKLNLGGSWNFFDEYAQNTDANATVHYKYSSKDVYFVASSPTPVRIKVTRDGGQPLGSDAGADVDANGFVTIQQDRLYKLVEGKNYGEHVLEIEIMGKGLKAYTFTFG